MSIVAERQQVTITLPVGCPEPAYSWGEEVFADGVVPGIISSMRIGRIAGRQVWWYRIGDQEFTERELSRESR